MELFSDVAFTATIPLDHVLDEGMANDIHLRETHGGHALNRLQPPNGVN